MTSEGQVAPVRHSFVFGAAAVVVAGGIAFFAGRMSNTPDQAAPGFASSARPAPAPPGSARAAPAPAFPPLNTFPEVSFAQQGEDLIIKNIFSMIGIAEATYLDVGAHDPIRGSNSYLFYALGSHGVLVEPNPTYAQKLKAARPRDVVIDKGVGTGKGKGKTATYYDFGDDGQENTFSSEQVERLAKLGMKPLRVIEMPLVDINDVIATNFPSSPPDLLSIDTEGLDLEILKTLDFDRFRPPVLCVETLEVGTNRTIDEIASFLRRKRYVTRGGTFVNTIFVAEEALARARSGSGDGGTTAR